MSENKQMAHPASMESTPTSFNQEDQFRWHVMTLAGRWR